MADTKGSKETEVVGLDDEPVEKKESSGGLKRLLIPGGIALGVFAASMMLSSFLATKKVPVENAPMVAEADSTSAASDTLTEVSHDAMDLSGLDTLAIMKELDYLFLQPGDEGDSASKAAADSTDSLSTIQKELARLNEEKASLDKKKKELDELENKVNLGLRKLEQAQSNRVISLARLYDGMRPEEVAKLFENLDDSVIVAIIPRMKAANAAKLLGLLPPKRAALLSTQMISVVEN